MDGDQIRQAREAMGWTQEQLATRVNVGARTIGNWERGATVPQNRHGRLVQVLAPALAGNADPIRDYSELTLLNELVRRAIERASSSAAAHPSS